MSVAKKIQGNYYCVTNNTEDILRLSEKSAMLVVVSCVGISVVILLRANYFICRWLCAIHTPMEQITVTWKQPLNDLKVSDDRFSMCILNMTLFLLINQLVWGHWLKAFKIRWIRVIGVEFTWNWLQHSDNSLEIPYMPVISLTDGRSCKNNADNKY